MNQEHGEPWWKFGHVWMVFAGPVVVVIASFVTLYLAIKTPDPVVSSYRQGGARPEAARLQEQTPTNMAPAMQARNHAATGVPAPVAP